MFTIIDPDVATVEVVIDGVPAKVPAGASAATALLLSISGATRRSPAAGEPRAPYCLMGTCFECLVEIDGSSSIRACMNPVRQGMVIRTGRSR